MPIFNRGHSATDAELESLVANLSPLNALREGYLRDLLNTSRTLSLAAGDLLFERGGRQAAHFYLLQGHLRLQFASGHSEIIDAEGQLLPVVNELPRPCTAEAVDTCNVLVVDSDRLDRNLGWSQASEYLLSVRRDGAELKGEPDWFTTVVNSNLFFKVPPVNAAKILSRLVPESVHAGDTIVRQGEPGHCCYFVKRGSARIVRSRPGGGVLHLADIGAGRCFGEDALVYDTLRNATVVMTSDGTLMRLDKADFDLLLDEPSVDEVSEADLHRLGGTPVFIDVRTRGEYGAGHLVMAANIPLAELHGQAAQLRGGVAYVFYCDTGRRSKAAAHLIGQRGFQAFALRGGLLGAGMQYQLISHSSYALMDGGIHGIRSAGASGQ